jgi:hypothetical protein
VLTETDYAFLLNEMAPTGLAPVVRALKEKSDIPNPNATAWTLYNKEGKMVCAVCGGGLDPMTVAAGKACGTCETMPLSAASALVRANYASSEAVVEKGLGRMLCEAAWTTEAVEAKKDDKGKALEGPRVKVILLTEGLGNIRDKNYYGPEAVKSMPLMFEGAVCMMNHQSYAEESNRPEGEVEKTVGYYKNLKAQEIEDGMGGKRWACVGELHFDLSEAGAEAYAKAKTAVHYQAEFPDTGKDYIGLSINAYGDAEPREMMIDGAMMEVNYVKRFVQVRSCDIVTMAGRGGKILALVESAAGAGVQNKEAQSMLMKKIKEAQKLLAEAQAEKDAALRDSKTAACHKVLEALMADLVKAGVTAKEGKDDGDADDADAKAKAEKAKKEKEKKDKEAADAEEAAAAKPSNSTDKEALSIAVKSLVKESGLSEAHFDMTELLGLPFQEAKREIAKVKRISEANVKAVLESIGPDARASHAAKTLEAGAEGAKDNNAAFADCSC